MRRRKLFLSIFALITCVVVSLSIALAALLLIQRGSQPSYASKTPTLLSAYTSSDGSFSFNYPVGWYVETLDGGEIDLENTPKEKRFESTDAIRLEIIPPTNISQFN